MPFTVKDLIEDKPKPITVKHSDTAQTALERMIEGDYSQLPIVDEDEKVSGMVTADSIVRALNHFKLTIKELHVVHAKQSVKSFTAEDDLFELLDDLKDAYAVIVVDNGKRITGIVTNYDTTEYFRRRGEDIMLVEDVETMLKEYILAAFQAETGDVDADALESAIEEITPSDARFRNDFNKAFNLCLEFDGFDKLIINRQQVEDLFVDRLSPKQLPKPFDRLTLSEYIDLFLSGKRWNKYKDIFKLETSACRSLLDPIREIRNALAHFRADLTAQQREKLRFCKDWLAQHQQEITENFAPKAQPSSESDSGSPAEEIEKAEAEVKDLILKFSNDSAGKENIEHLVPIQFVEETNSEESKYSKLATFLQSIPLKQDVIQLEFNNIETIIEAELPRTARLHRSWWANDSVGHVQSRQWLEVGWRVSSVNISQEKATFARIEEREKTYIDFFSDLLAGLRQTENFDSIEVSPSGRGYITLDTLASEDGSKLTFLGCSFARGGKFRVELYIDTGDYGKNAEIFEKLFKEKREVESFFGVPLQWEYLETRRASRIAAYHLGSITDGKDDLKTLQSWAVRYLNKFYDVFHKELKNQIMDVNL